MRLLTRLRRALHRRRGRHLDTCDECMLRQRRERQYLERLHRAEVPAASDELTARLLARTEELARSDGENRPERTDRTEGPARPILPDIASGVAPPRAVRGRRRARQPVVFLAAGAAAAALLGGSAYAMGADPAPAAAGTAASALLPPDRPETGPDPVEAGPGAPAGWSLTGQPDFTPAGSLSSDELRELRAEGWTCPELQEAGYHLVWARNRVMADADVLELRLTDGRHFATVIEQHSSRTVPVNVLTGHPVTADGFSSVPVPAAGTAPAAPGALWVHAAKPFAAVYQAGGSTFTYVSDLAADQADDGVAALIRARALARGAAGGSAPDFSTRMERGLGRIVEMLAP